MGSKLFYLLKSWMIIASLVIFFGLIIMTFGALDILRAKLARSDPVVGLWAKRTWARLMLKWHGVRVQFHGPLAHVLHKQSGVVIVGNHQSYVDVLVGIAFFPGNTHFVAKRELAWLPFFGWAAALVGTLFINRSKGAQNSSLQSVKASLHKGDNISIYPEGTRSCDGLPLPFRRGAFIMAIDAQVPLLPVVMFDSRIPWPKGTLYMIPGMVNVFVGEPFMTQGLTFDDRHRLSDEVRLWMSLTLENFTKSRKNEVIET